MRKHANKFRPGILLVGLTLLFEDGADAVERPVETVFVLEAEVQLPVLQRVHHVCYLLDVLLARPDSGNHRHHNGNDNSDSDDMPEGKAHSPYFFSLAYSVGRLTPSILAAAEILPSVRSIA